MACVRAGSMTWHQQMTRGRMRPMPLWQPGALRNETCQSPPLPAVSLVVTASGWHGRGSVFDRLGHAAHDEEAHAGRRSVFDRIQGAPVMLA